MVPGARLLEMEGLHQSRQTACLIDAHAGPQAMRRIEVNGETLNERGQEPAVSRAGMCGRPDDDARLGVRHRLLDCQLVFLRVCRVTKRRRAGKPARKEFKGKRQHRAKAKEPI